MKPIFQTLLFSLLLGIQSSHASMTCAELVEAIHSGFVIDRLFVVIHQVKEFREATQQLLLQRPSVPVLSIDMGQSGGLSSIPQMSFFQFIETEHPGATMQIISGGGDYFPGTIVARNLEFCGGSVGSCVRRFLAFTLMDFEDSALEEMSLTALAIPMYGVSHIENRRDLYLQQVLLKWGPILDGWTQSEPREVPAGYEITFTSWAFANKRINFLLSFETR